MALPSRNQFSKSKKRLQSWQKNTNSHQARENNTMASTEDHGEQNLADTNILSGDDEVLQEITKQVEQSLILNIVVFYPLLVIYFIIAFYLVSKHVPYLFIDEIFHVPQTLRYLQGEWFSWHPKITTPPGLYILGWMNYKILKYIPLWKKCSTLTLLRTTNWFGGVIVWPVFVLRPMFYFQALGFWPTSLMAFPLLSTYYTLYYTDVWSTIFIVQALTYVITLPFGETKSIWLSALCVLISVIFRQTNIIWSLFILVLVVERRALIEQNFNTLWYNNYLKTLIHALENFYKLVLPYALNFVLFCIFLVYNRSITLGDKTNHVAGVHLVQVFYCYMFMAFFSMPLWFSKTHLVNYKTRFFSLKTFGQLILIIFIIRFFTKVHPFLLADNRHYTFYIYKKILNRNKLFKYVLCPIVYHFSRYTVHELMRMSLLPLGPMQGIKVKNTLDVPSQLTHVSWNVFYFCMVLTLVPSPLFEPRYYILPYIFWRVFVIAPYDSFTAYGVDKKSNLHRLKLELLWMVLINVVTLFIFLKFKFSWTTEAFPQRIIW